jgi:1-phosphofructokinase family hexose kinase
MIYTVTLNPALDRELTVPALEYDEVLRATSSRVDFGGKGFNVSRMLASLGTPSVALGFAGGRTGDALREGLEQLGIATEFVPIAGETRTNISIVPHDHARHIKVNEPGPAITDSERAALVERVRTLARPGDWWVLAGSLPPGLAPGLYAELIDIIQSAGARVLLDTSGEALRAGCAARPFLLKPNGYEASQLTGRPVDTPAEALAAAQALASIEQVVISLGAAGAVLVAGGRGWLATPPAIVQRNPIGAGDSLVAGLAWSLSQSYPPEQVLCWAVACGAATAAHDGTAVGTRDEVARLAAQVRLDPIA